MAFSSVSEMGWWYRYFFHAIIFQTVSICNNKNELGITMWKSDSLQPVVLSVIQGKETEKPFLGEYDNFGEKGTYLCRQCGLALFRSETKFHSGCGWPSFDEAIEGAVLEEADRDGHRVEIVCVRCHGHLGHVFTEEQFTAKNTRHCVNSVSLDFVEDFTVLDTGEAIFAAGCFWGVEHYFKTLPGVLKTQVGYSGGFHPNPSYQEICEYETGHFEVIRVIYDLNKINYEALVKYFFEIHDFTQTDGQGPDIGEQYLSRIFYFDEDQRAIAQNIIEELRLRRYDVVTQILPVSVFWPAEGYHQQYYEKTGKLPFNPNLLC